MFVGLKYPQSSAARLRLAYSMVYRIYCWQGFPLIIGVI